MKTIIKSILIFGIILSSLIVNGQTNYYVSVSGSNSNNGMLSSPWLTIQHGLNQLGNGDTLNVMSGTYNEKLQIPISGITLRNYLAGNAIVDASGITSQTAILEINNVSSVLINGLELKNSIMLDAQGIAVEGNCQHITIQNCKIHDIHFSSNPNAVANANTNAQGIIIYGSNSAIAISGLKVLNNQLHDCRLGYSEGITVNGNVNGFEISGNTVYNLTNIGIDVVGHEGTSSNPANDQARNGFVKNNTVHDCLSLYATSGGLYVDGGKNVVIENNTSFHNGYGIEVGCENIGKTTDSITVRNNIFYDNQICAVAFGGYDYPNGSGKVINSSFRNNTCYYDDYTSSGDGEIYLSYSEHSIIENNIFFTTSQNNLAYAELTQPTLVFNHNFFYCQAGTSSLSADWNGNTYNSYSAFATGTGTNANSIFGNPLFVAANITTPDFHVTATSPAINAGNPSFTAASGEMDIDGQNRTNGIVDCGADEFYSLTTGITGNENLFNQLKIYPNPSSDYITIMNTNLEIKQIIIYDVIGKRVGVFEVENEFEIQLSVSDYPAGVYTVVAFDEKQQLVNLQKLIVQNTIKH
jgi:hypothetical protein